MKCLIVEDDPASRYLLKEYLQPYGECYVTDNGLLAVQTYRNSLEENDHYNLVCSGVRMPHMNGYELIGEIQNLEREYSIPDNSRSKIMMVSALSNPFIISKAYELGCDSFLIKPIDMNKFSEEMEILGFSPELSPNF